MNAWTAAALVVIAGTVPACLWGAARGSAVRRLAAVSLLTSATGGVFLMLPQGYGRSSYQDLALVLAVLAPAGTLVFTRFVAAEGHDQATGATGDGGTGGGERGGHDGGAHGHEQDEGGTPGGGPRREGG